MKNIFNKTVISLIVVSMVLGVILASAILITKNNKVPTMVSNVMSDLGVEPAKANETNDEISTFSFGMTSKHYTAGSKTVYVRIDGRDTIFGDDVVLDFSCNVWVKVDFSVDYMLNGSVRKTRTWSHTGISGGQILNSGMTKIDKIVVTFTIDGIASYTEEFLAY